MKKQMKNKHTILTIFFVFLLKQKIQADIIIIYKCPSSSGYCAARFATTKKCSDFVLDSAIVKDCIDVPRQLSN